MDLMSPVLDSWRHYTVRVLSRTVDPAELNHTYTVEGYELHNTSRTIYREGVVPFRRLFPPPIKIEPLGVGETGVLDIDQAGVFRFHPHTPERPKFKIDCDDGGNGGGNGNGGNGGNGGGGDDMGMPINPGEPITGGGGISP